MKCYTGDNECKQSHSWKFCYYLLTFRTIPYKPDIREAQNFCSLWTLYDYNYHGLGSKFNTFFESLSVTLSWSNRVSFVTRVTMSDSELVSLYSRLCDYLCHHSYGVIESSFQGNHREQQICTQLFEVKFYTIE